MALPVQILAHHEFFLFLAKYNSLKLYAHTLRTVHAYTTQGAQTTTLTHTHTHARTHTRKRVRSRAHTHTRTHTCRKPRTAAARVPCTWHGRELGCTDPT